MQALTIAAEHPAYAGHFPEAPILPGVVLLDEALAAIAPLYALAGDAVEIVSVKFTRPVRPAEPLRLEHRRAADASIRFAVKSGEHAVLIGAVRKAPAHGGVA